MSVPTWTCGKCLRTMSVVRLSVAKHPPRQCELPRCKVAFYYGSFRNAKLYAVRESLPPIAQQVVRAAEQLGTAP